jgi:alkylresorcinol/alkylpyrone synthase
MSVLMSVATEWPSHAVSVDETKQFLSAYVGADALDQCRRQVDALGVVERRTLAPLRQMVRLGGIEARNACYADEAVTLGTRAACKALADARLHAADIDRLIVSSSTGFVMPSLADHLAIRLHLRPNVERLPLTGLGCAGSLRALAAVQPHHEPAGVRTLIVSVELCSLWLQPEEPSPEDVLSAMTFGDGAAAAVVANRTPTARPEIVACESLLWPGTLNARGALLTSTGFRHVASSTLAVSVLRNLRESVIDFLARHDLSLERLGFVVVNPRNERLLAAMAHLLSVPETRLGSARQVWQSRGNTLSVGPLYLLQVMQRTAPPRQGDFGVVIVLGPGVSCELMLLRWHGEVACESLQA